MSNFETIRFDRRNHVGILTLTRPEKRNAQNPLMWQELADLGTHLLAMSSLRCLIAAGEGARLLGRYRPHRRFGGNDGGIGKMQPMTKRLGEPVKPRALGRG